MPKNCVDSSHQPVIHSREDIESCVDPNEISVAIMGIVPTKVTAEHGAVIIDDMLVAFLQLSKAIKSTDQDHVQDATIGKASQPLARDAAVVNVLVGAQ